jgi:hypothetical protein
MVLIIVKSSLFSRLERQACITQSNAVLKPAIYYPTLPFGVSALKVSRTERETPNRIRLSYREPDRVESLWHIIWWF